MMKKSCLFALGLSLLLPAALPLASASSSPALASPAYPPEVDEALDNLVMNVDMDAVVADFLLPIEGLYGIEFSYASSNDEALSISIVQNEETGKKLRARAKVTRLATDTNVTLTVFATLPDGKEPAAKRSYSLTILKAVGAVEETLPLAITEDFSSYELGLDLGDYFTYDQSGSESRIATIVDGSRIASFNDAPSPRFLEVKSERATSDTRYTRKANVTVADTPNGAYLEGEWMFHEDSNGIGIELLSGSSIVGGIILSSSSLSQYVAGSYLDLGFVPRDGVWLKFRLLFRPKNGYSILEVFDQGAWKTLGDSNSLFLKGYGLASGNKGDITGFRLSARKGSAKGASYLANVRVGLSSSIGEEDHNRALGLGRIEGYEPSFFLESDSEDLSKADASSFDVYNRFKDEKLVLNTDYSVSTQTEELPSSTRFTHTFTLLSSGETKTVTQEVYRYSSSDAPGVDDFSVSALKKDDLDETKSKVQVSGVLTRDATSLSYLVLEQGSPVPTEEDILGGNAAFTGYVTSGSTGLLPREFSFDIHELNPAKKYDVYALPIADTYRGQIRSSLDISPLINVRTAKDFYDMATNVDTAYSTFRIVEDIDFSSFYWPIESDAFKFYGKIEGEGHAISNLSLVTTLNRGGIFPEFRGEIRDLSFVNVEVASAGNAGILAGQAYGGVYENLSFRDCSVAIEPTLEGGEGYFGGIAGRFRGDGTTVQMNAIDIENLRIDCPKYCGLLTGGFEKGVQTSIESLSASGDIFTDGAAIGLIGRNRGKTKIKNLLSFLHLRKGKKEVGVVAGHNKEGGSLNVENAILDLKIDEITQAGYFGSFIGSHDPSTSTYSLQNVSYLSEDYSHISESITFDPKAITAGKEIRAPESKEEWEKRTFIRDFDVSTSFAYDAKANRPVLHMREESSISFVAGDFEKYALALNEEAILSNHYLLVKAGNVYRYLKDEEKAKIDPALLQKYERVLALYNAYVGDSSAIESEWTKEGK